MSVNDEKNKNLESILLLGIEILGPTASSLAGFMTGGPMGAVIGGGGGVILSKALIYLAGEVAGRTLSDREKVRIGAVMGYSILKIEERIKKGEIIRSDNFFNKDYSNRSDADEIYEGIIISAQREHEEKKIKYLGNMMANLAFDKSVDKNQANFYIEVSKGLTFRQLCLIKLISKIRRNFYHEEIRKENYREEKDFNSKQVSLLTEIYDLFNKNLIACSDGVYLIDIVDINPSKLVLDPVGLDLYYLMELEDIEEEYLEDLIRLLRHKESGLF